MSSVDASVTCRKSIKVIDDCLQESYRTGFDSFRYSSSFALENQRNKFVRIQDDLSIYPKTISSRVFRYVTQNGTVLKFTKIAEEKGVDTHDTLSSASPSRSKKETYRPSKGKFPNQNNTRKKTESVRCSNIYSSPRSQRKIVTMLKDINDENLKDHGSLRCQQHQIIGMANKKKIKGTEQNSNVNHFKFQTNTKYKNVKCDESTARKPTTLRGNINLTLIKSKELTVNVPKKVYLSKKLMTCEKELKNNTIKNTNLSVTAGHLECNGISLNMKNVVGERNIFHNEPSEVSKKCTNIVSTDPNEETTIHINYLEKSQYSNRNSSPRELLIPPFTIKTKECNKFLNLNIDETKFENIETPIQQGTMDIFSLSNNTEKYKSVELDKFAEASYPKKETCVSTNCGSEFQVLDLSLPNCPIGSQSMLIHPDPDQTNVNLPETTLTIERSIVRYSTHRNINIKVQESNKENVDNCSNNEYANDIGNRPFNIMSVVRKQLKVGNKSNPHVKTSNSHLLDDVHNSSILNLSKVRDKDKIQRENIPHNFPLIKPSDIIKEVSKARDLFKSIENFSAKFQKEVYFLDSFIESIESLDKSTVEICSTINSDDGISSTKGVIQDTISSKNQSIIHMDNLERNFSKSICWLNLFIGNEYRRAKNLLFILKLREDALKDFSRSQIIWLERRKYNNYTDVCTLKKKQRGVLLKLQQECGEMHRIKKILLDITEKKNAILIQNKRNMEEKVSEVLINTDMKSVQRFQPEKNRSPRHSSPLKCFNLSGMSYSDDSSELKQIECNSSFNNIVYSNSSMKYSSMVKSENKEQYSVGSIKYKCEDKDFMLVDGTYLNILFKKLNLPQIFSHGKEYDVHSTALQGLVNSVNKLFEFNETTEELQRDDPDIISFSTVLTENSSSKNSSPSTARSLVEEFGELFDTFTLNEDSNHKNSIGSIAKENTIIKSEVNQKLDSQTSDMEKNIHRKKIGNERQSCREAHISDQEQSLHVSSDSAASPKRQTNTVEIDVETTLRNYCDFHSGFQNIEEHIQNQSEQSHVRHCNRDIQIYVQDECDFYETMNNLQNVKDTNLEIVSTTPNMPVFHLKNDVDCLTCAKNDTGMEEDDSEISPPGESEESVSEVEALRRKQLAIEIEIKALEHQQSQLTYCIREIPDKPPPPYTPPIPETKSNNDITTNLCMSDMFISKEFIEDSVNQFFRKLDTEDSIDQIIKEDGSVVHNEVIMCHDFIRDYCKESINKSVTVKSDTPWECANLLLQLPSSRSEVESLVTTSICDIIVYNPAQDIFKSVQELQMKRYDYIEEILFAEWNKCEKEWTSLENNEILVKNQLVNEIIIKELDEMLDEFLELS